jgi:hypothetical protein
VPELLRLPALHFWDNPNRQLTLIAVLAVVTSLILVGVAHYVSPFTTGGLVDVIIAAVAFPLLAVWAGRISTQLVVAALDRSAKQRNELLSLGIERLGGHLREAITAQTTELQKYANTASKRIDELSASALEGLGAIKSSVDSLAVVIQTGQASEAEQRLVTARATEQLKAEISTLRAQDVQREALQQPDLYIQTQQRGGIIWDHHWMLLGNVGGNARKLVLSYRFHGNMEWLRLDPAFDLEPQVPWERDLGRVKDAGGSATLYFSIEVRDDIQHVYESGACQVPLAGNEWKQVLLRRTR